MPMKPRLRILCLNLPADEQARCRQHLSSRPGIEVIEVHSVEELPAILAATEADRFVDAESLRHLARQLMEAQEAERRHWSKHLHDELGQTLSILKMRLQLLRQQRPASEAATFAPCIAAADAALQQVREMALQVRPSLLDDLGLASALRWLAGRVQAESGLPVRLRLPEHDTRWPPAVETACFRIAQEAIANAARHAKATRIDVHLSEDAELALHIADDGQGFVVAEQRRLAAEARGLGLRAMEERAAAAGGAFSIDSAPRRGTRVAVHFPAPAGGGASGAPDEATP